MSINYKQLQTLVKEAIADVEEIEESAASEIIPLRMPAADLYAKEPDMGDDDANSKYDIGCIAREAAEQFVEALDQPIYDAAYEHAFKASACLRRALLSLVDVGAHPMPMQRTIAPDSSRQRFNVGQHRVDNYLGGDIGLEEGQDKIPGDVSRISIPIGRIPNIERLFDKINTEEEFETMMKIFLNSVGDDVGADSKAKLLRSMAEELLGTSNTEIGEQQ